MPPADFCCLLLSALVLQSLQQLPLGIPLHVGKDLLPRFVAVLALEALPPDSALCDLLPALWPALISRRIGKLFDTHRETLFEPAIQAVQQFPGLQVDWIGLAQQLFDLAASPETDYKGRERLFALRRT